MSRIGAFLLRLAALLTLAAASSGAPEDVERRIYFSALDKSEKPVPGLTAQDFELRINGKPVVPAGFRSAAPHTDRSTPVVAWILIDFNPNINAAVIRGQAAAAGAVFKLFHPESAFGVKLVTNLSETLAPLGHDPEAMRAAFTEYARRRTELSVDAAGGTVRVGPAGILGALDDAIDEIDSFTASRPSLRGMEPHRAVMVLSDGNINPSVKKKPLFEKAARSGVHLYPVFVPRAGYGPWVSDYYELAKKTAGVASVFGSLTPGSRLLPLPRYNLDANALSFNFIHMARDLNGKYSFLVRHPAGRNEVRIRLKCRRKGVEIRLPLDRLP